MASEYRRVRPLIPVGKYGGSRGTIARLWSSFVKTEAADLVRDGNREKRILREKRHLALEKKRNERGPALKRWKRRVPKALRGKATMRSLQAQMRRTLRDLQMGSVGVDPKED